MLASTKARLDAVADIDKVGTAISLAAALDRKPGRAVEAFVVPISERPGDSRRVTGLALQEVQVTVGVVIAIRALNDPDGERGHDRLESVRDAVRDELLGWTPNGATVPYLVGNSDLVKMAPGALWWLDRYLTKTQRKQRG